MDPRQLSTSSNHKDPRRKTPPLRPFSWELLAPEPTHSTRLHVATGLRNLESPHIQYGNDISDARHAVLVAAPQRHPPWQMGSAAPINSVDYSTGWVAQSSSVLPVPLQHVFEPSGNQNPYNGPGGPLHTAFMTSSSPGTDSFDFTTQPSRDTTAAVSSIGAVWPGLRPGPRALMPTCPSTNSNAAIGIPPPNGSTSLESHSVLETPSPNHVPARVVISQAPLPYSLPNPPAFGTRSHLQDTKCSSIDTAHTRLINCPLVPHDESPPKEAPQFEMPLSNAEDILRGLPASHRDGSTEYIRHLRSPHPSPPPSPQELITLRNDPRDDRRAKKRRASPSDQGPRRISMAGSPVKQITTTQPQTSAVGTVHTNNGCFKCRERRKKCPLQQDERGWCLECRRLGWKCPGGYGSARSSGKKRASRAKTGNPRQRMGPSTKSVRGNESVAEQAFPGSSVVPSNAPARVYGQESRAQQIPRLLSQPPIPPIAVTAPSPSNQLIQLVASEDIETASLFAHYSRPYTPTSATSELSTVFTASPASSSASAAIRPLSLPPSPNIQPHKVFGGISGLSLSSDSHSDNTAGPSSSGSQLLFAGGRWAEGYNPPVNPDPYAPGLRVEFSQVPDPFAPLSRVSHWMKGLYPGEEIIDDAPQVLQEFSEHRGRDSFPPLDFGSSSHHCDSLP